MRRFLFYWLPALLWMGVIFLLSTSLGSASNTSLILEPVLHFFVPGISAEAMERAHYVVRKTAHFTEYALLAILWWRVLVHVHAADVVRSVWLCAILALLIATVYAATDEYHQAFVGSRTASLQDVMIDACGAFGGAVLVLLWRAWRIRLARRV